MDPLILGIETATDRCSVALHRGSVPVSGAVDDRARRHAERLVPMIEGLMNDAGIAPGDLDVVAVSAGPGSYTGLRIGASTAKGIAEGCGARLVAVPTLEALVLAASEAVPSGHAVVAALPSRRSEVYAALFRFDAEGRPRTVAAPAAGTPETVAAAWNVAGPVAVVGDGAPRLAAALGPNALVLDSVRADAQAVVRIGLRLYREGHFVDVANFEPYYLTDFVARIASRSVFDRLPS